MRPSLDDWEPKGLCLAKAEPNETSKPSSRSLRTGSGGRGVASRLQTLRDLLRGAKQPKIGRVSATR